MKNKINKNEWEKLHKAIVFICQEQDRCYINSKDIANYFNSTTQKARRLLDYATKNKLLVKAPFLAGYYARYATNDEWATLDIHAKYSGNNLA